jgi:hypothetical protein
VSALMAAAVHSSQGLATLEPGRLADRRSMPYLENENKQINNKRK